MSIPFSDSVNNLGGVQQIRTLCRVDASQWPTYNIVNSYNNYLDEVTGYALGADNRFDFDDSNHTRLPIGTTNLTANQKDYSFLTDEQGNAIITLLRIDILGSDGIYRPLRLIHKDDIPDIAIDEYQKTAGIPTEYMKLADNIVRLFPKPSATVAAGLQFYFQRTGSVFAPSDTTKAPGVSPLLHRGFVIYGAYDCALTLGLPNLQALSVEKAMEQKKMIKYFSVRNEDERLNTFSGELIDSR